MRLASLPLLAILAGCATVSDIAATAKRLEFASGGICSGTAVAADKVLTAGHCIRNDALARVSGKTATVTKVAVVGPDAVELTVTGIHFDRWAYRSKPLLGERVRWIGNPLGEAGVYREGYIAKVSDNTIVIVGTVCPGDSGAGVMSATGAVVGVVSAMTNRSACAFTLASP